MKALLTSFEILASKLELVFVRIAVFMAFQQAFSHMI